MSTYYHFFQRQNKLTNKLTSISKRQQDQSNADSLSAQYFANYIIVKQLYDRPQCQRMARASQSPPTLFTTLLSTTELPCWAGGTSMLSIVRLFFWECARSGALGGWARSFSFFLDISRQLCHRPSHKTHTDSTHRPRLRSIQLDDGAPFER